MQKNLLIAIYQKDIKIQKIKQNCRKYCVHIAHCLFYLYV